MNTERSEITVIDANRTCWNCKHFAPDDRESSPDGDCCALPPRTPIQGPSYAFPRVKANLAWCGEWERTNIDPGPIPEPVFGGPSVIDAITMNNTANEIREFAKAKDIELPKGISKTEMLILIEEHEGGK